jgi:ABC-2 type transport system permease protein
MKNFFILLKKEIKELLTPQMILPLIIMVILFAGIGSLVGNETKKAQKPRKIVIVQNDSGELVNSLIETARSKFDPQIVSSISSSEAVEKAREIDAQAVFIFPSNFTASINAGAPAKIEAYYLLKSFSMMGTQSVTNAKIFLSGANEQVSNYVISRRIVSVDPVAIKNPVATVENVVVGDVTATVSPEAVISFVTQQTTFIPIILFIIMAAQMIATSVASEKENKTLETLLSLPISRRQIVAAKLIAAGVVALLMAGVYMFGFRYYIDGLSGGQATNVTAEMKQAIDLLGLKLDTSGYLMLGGSLFFGILSALSVAMILGVFAEDTKAVQGVITPLMVLVMIPYLITLLLDFNSMSQTVKYLVYAIPFSHPFLAAPNIFMKNYFFVFAGIAYQAVFFLVFVVIAAKIFSSDKITTIKLNFSKKKQ